MTEESRAPLHAESLLSEPDAPRLFAQSWMPPDGPRAVVAIVHGLAEHSGRYAPVAYELAGLGYGVHALDLRGHGRSEGDRAYVKSFAEYLDDVDRFLEHARMPDRPLFVLGHSMGGAVVALGCVTGRIKADGIVLSGAALPGGSKMPRMLGAAVSLAAKVLPKTPTVRLDAESVSRDPEVVARYIADPLVYRGRLRAGFAAAFARAMERIERDVANFDHPLLLIHGGADALVSPQASRWLAENVASEDVTLNVYDGLFHEVLNEPEREKVIADVSKWLEGHIAAPGDADAEAATA
jgi:acylglycerol lipase